MIRLLRFKDLQARGIINNWPMLKRRIERDNFPCGVMVGPNQRAWIEEEVDAWIKSRPAVGPGPKGVAKSRCGRPRKTKAADSTATA
jgi:predicted DNA-binding transcriptional regulator AlpA